MVQFDQVNDEFPFSLKVHAWIDAASSKTSRPRAEVTLTTYFVPGLRCSIIKGGVLTYSYLNAVFADRVRATEIYNSRKENSHKIRYRN